MNRTVTRRRGIASLVLALAVFVASSCAPTRPYTEPWKGVAWVDSHATPGQVRLDWIVTTDSSDPAVSTWWDFPVPRSGPKLHRVSVLRSTTGRAEDFQIIRSSTHSGRDSMVVSGLVDGPFAWFRVAGYDIAGREVLTSRTIVTSAGTALPVLSSFPLRLQSRFDWSTDGESLACALPIGAFSSSLNLVSTRTGGVRELRRDPAAVEWIGDVSYEVGDRRLLFTRTPSLISGEADYRVWAWDFATGTAASLTPGRVDGGAASAPGGQICFTRGTVGPPNIPQLHRQVATTGGSSVVLGASAALYCFRPAVRAGDGRIVFDGFSTANSQYGKSHLYSTDMNDAPRQPVTWDDRFTDSFATWAEDGTSVYFVSDRSGHAEIWKLHPPTGALRQITRTSADRLIEGYRVSRDGSKIALAIRVYGQLYEQHLLELDGMPGR